MDLGAYWLDILYASKSQLDLKLSFPTTPELFSPTYPKETLLKLIPLIPTK